MPPNTKPDTSPADQAQAPSAPPQLRLRALHPVRHDGTRYGPGLPAGDEFGADGVTAAELSGLGVVELLGEESPE